MIYHVPSKSYWGCRSATRAHSKIKSPKPALSLSCCALFLLKRRRLKLLQPRLCPSPLVKLSTSNSKDRSNRTHRTPCLCANSWQYNSSKYKNSEPNSANVDSVPPEPKPLWSNPLCLSLSHSLTFIKLSLFCKSQLNVFFDRFEDSEQRYARKTSN